ncbi:HD-GYP domain-containing protein [Acetonema longum]|uniref:Metal dependent phosphohydrolase n=1 Tax=Acetonema longum DSM 6540 TaxID=1009370 RepID=F7NI35_9FIRM|nr:HD-GYP domain-containing protein [Acetonema longum]EGO64267.1 metal dependent phosphohydrolase [Acetonema longum DSM 6540]
MQRITVSEAKLGMKSARSIYNADGRLLLAEGVPFNDYYIKRLNEIGLPALYIQSPLSADVKVPQLVQEETRIMVTQLVQKSFDGLRAGKRVDLDQFKEMAKSIVDEVIQNRHTMIHLNDIRIHDDYTFGHCVNTCILATLTGVWMDYNEKELYELSLGALLHDTGKALIHKDILNKRGQLNPKEMTEMQRHPEYGFDILRRYSQELSMLVVHVAYQHHEKCDGKGYPRGLAREEIHEYARITSIADVYDALTSDRSYRSAMLPHEAYEIMQAGSGTQFDTEILKIFLQQIAVYPVGAFVELNNGEIGVVIQVNRNMPTRPKVRIVMNVAKQFCSPESNQEQDLHENLTCFVSKVLSRAEVAKLEKRFALQGFTAELQEQSG